MKKYPIKTKRLGLRAWHESDRSDLFTMNSDCDVMRYFPAALNEKESNQLFDRLVSHFESYGYGYYAVDRLIDGKFIGFLGLMNQNFKSEFTPCVDIGWRIRKEFWGQGFATEGALACLNLAFSRLYLNTIFSFAPVLNKPSIKVMEKIGMTRVSVFDHPKIPGGSPLKKCVVYKSEA